MTRETRDLIAIAAVLVVIVVAIGALFLWPTDALLQLLSQHPGGAI